MRSSLLPTLAFLALVSPQIGIPATAEVESDWIGIPLQEALERLREMGHRLIYSTELVQPSMRVEEQPSGDSLNELLDALLSPHGLIARRGANGLIVITLAPRPPPGGTLQGVVLANDTGLPISGALVHVNELSRQKWTYKNGEFELTGVRYGNYVVTAVAPGYAKHEITVRITSKNPVIGLRFELSPQPRFLQEVVVTPSKYGLLNNQPSSRLFLDRQEVQQTPHLSDDLFRVLHRMPGAAAGDISAAFAMRGSGPDEIKIVLDGLQIDEPYHLKDFLNALSIIDSEAVAGVELLTGGYPVEHGDRMGGIVTIDSVIPDNPRRSLGLSLLTARFLAEDTSDDGDSTWQLSLRRGYLNWAFQWWESIDEDPDFTASPSYYDLFGSVRHAISARSHVDAHLLGSYDSFHHSNGNATEEAWTTYASWYLWGNLLTSWPSGLSVNTMVSVSDIRRTIEGETLSIDGDFTEVDDDRHYTLYGLKQDWIYEPSRTQLVKWGIDARHASASYNFRSYSQTTDPILTGGGPPVVTRNRTQKRPSGLQYGLYAANRFRLAPGVTAEAGLRWDRQTWTPGDDQISPRFNLVWEVATVGTLRASWGRFSQSQGIHQLQVEDGLDTFQPAQWSEHTVLSFQRRLNSGIGIRLEAYQKTMTDLRPYFENLFDAFNLFPAGKSDRVRLDPDRAEARGIELSLKSPRKQKLSWWASYTISAAEDHIDGSWQPRSWDQRHALSFSVNWTPGRRWNVNVSGVSHTGWPRTPVYGRWILQTNGTYRFQPVFGPRNSIRYPNYRRIDLRISRWHPLPKGSLRYFFEVSNLTNRENIRAVESVDVWPGPNGTTQTSFDYESWIPILPSFGIVWEF